MYPADEGQKPDTLSRVCISYFDTAHVMVSEGVGKKQTDQKFFKECILKLIR